MAVCGRLSITEEPVFLDAGQELGLSDEAQRLLSSMPYMEVDDSFSSLFYLRMRAYHMAKINRNYPGARELIQKDIALAKKLFPDDPSIVCLDSANLCELHYMMGDTAKAMEMVMAI